MTLVTRNDPKNAKARESIADGLRAWLDEVGRYVAISGKHEEYVTTLNVILPMNDMVHGLLDDQVPGVSRSEVRELLTASR